MEILNFSEYLEWISNNFLLTEVIIFVVVLYVLMLTIALNAIGLIWKEWI